MATTPPLRRADESADDDLAAGSEGDGAIEFDGRLGVFVADPGCAERLSGLAVRLAAGDDIDLAIPGLEDANGERRRAAEAEEADALSALHSGDAEAAEADDARAEQRGDVGSVEPAGSGMAKSARTEGELRVAAVDRVAGEYGVVAEVLHARGGRTSNRRRRRPSRRRRRALRWADPGLRLPSPRRRSDGRG